ncbi:RidA family protein [Dactylosporangium sp. CA-233914]|uniref:RidA family protein n=1 Tax=Dactylosporangium sp. CA-233914 TaxID=3239934 RepID=UPI003D93A89D
MIKQTARHDPVVTDRAPAPSGAYSQGIVAGDLLFTSGVGGHHPISGRLGATVEEQTRQALHNIEAVLGARGLGLADVVKATVHLQDVQRDFAAFNDVYRSMFDPPYPVRTTVGSTLLGMLVEIDVVARFPPTSSTH